jgi:hypothetical protein
LISNDSLKAAARVRAFLELVGEGVRRQLQASAGRAKPRR